MLNCTICGTEFKRPASRGPIPKYCSQACITKSKRTDHRRKYERLYRSLERLKGKRRQYEYEYNRRPEIREKNRKRRFWKWHNDPVYRAKQLLRWGDPYPGLELPAPYSGHRWLDMARNLVAPSGVESSAPWADDKYDEMGEALLALLEGKDMREAVRDFRKQEYVPRYLTISMEDFRNDEDDSSWFERVLPTIESAEDEYITYQYVQSRFNDVHTKRSTLKHKTQQPRRRRMKDAGINDKRR